MKHTLRIRQDGKEHNIDCEAGQTITQALNLAGFAQDLPCGGRGACGKCRVGASGAIEPPDETEKTLLKDALQRGTRLSCRARIAGDCVVTLQNQAGMQISSGKESRTAQFHPLYQNYGVAGDIGTTTLAAQLYRNGSLICDTVASNPQSAYGADVMTRIGASLAGQSDILQRAVVDGIEAMIERMTSDCGIDKSNIDGMVLTGNTTMLYLLTGRNPETLSHAPFAADCLFDMEYSARDLGFSFDATCYLPMCIAAFVGADISTAILSSGMLERDETALLVDIGTNGEMALWHEGKLLCCATAAGPAFEGAQIECGCHGIPGAVDHVWVEEQRLNYHTIHDAEAVGICGSGIIDAVAALLENETIDETGRMVLPDLEINGQSVAKIASAVYVTQKDIRSVQLAKSAICAGIRTLLHITKVSAAQVKTFYIAGGFGSFIDLKSAAEIGLFPAELIDVARVIGNAAETGAAMLLQDQSLLYGLNEVLYDAAAIDLSANSYFMDQYVEGMCF